MYKVLIVDDENLVRVAFRTIVDYEQYGFTICGTASDGIEALKICEKENPDVIITDIKMPRMDGLQLIAQLKQQQFSGQIILISNYDDFELVRQGLVMGVTDYLLKLTIGPEQMVELLMKIKKTLDETARRRKADELAMESMNKLRQQEMVSTWKKLLLSKQLVETDVPQDLLSNGPLNIFIVKIVQYGAAMRVSSQKDVNLLEYAVMNIGSEILVETDCTGGLGEGDFFFVCPAGNVSSPEFAAKKLSFVLSQYLNVTAVVLYEQQIRQASHLFEALRRCPTLDDRVFYCDQSYAARIICQTESGSWSVNIPKFTESLYAALREGNDASIYEAVNQQMEVCKTERVSRDEVLVKWSSILMRLRERIEGFAQEDALEDIELRIMQIKTESELKECLLEMLRKMIKSFRPVQPGLAGEQEVAKVLAYIHSHIDERITLGKLAKMVNFNETYLCTVFRSHAGTSIVNYINQSKIERAADYLRESKLQIKEIASKLGFNDQFYFNKMFHKYYGMSPSEYRKKQNSTNFK